MLRGWVGVFIRRFWSRILRGLGTEKPREFLRPEILGVLQGCGADFARGEAPDFARFRDVEKIVMGAGNGSAEGVGSSTL